MLLSCAAACLMYLLKNMIFFVQDLIEFHSLFISIQNNFFITQFSQPVFSEEKCLSPTQFICEGSPPSDWAILSWQYCLFLQ